MSARRDGIVSAGRGSGIQAQAYAPDIVLRVGDPVVDAEHRFNRCGRRNFHGWDGSWIGFQSCAGCGAFPCPLLRGDIKFDGPFRRGGVSGGAGSGVSCGARVVDGLVGDAWVVCGTGVEDGSAGSSSFFWFCLLLSAALSCASGVLPAGKEMASLSTGPAGTVGGASVISTVGWGGWSWVWTGTVSAQPDRVKINNAAAHGGGQNGSNQKHDFRHLKIV